MTRVADDTRQRVADDVLGKAAVQQWELFRRVKEGTLDPDVILMGFKILTFGEQPIGIVVDADHTGISFRVHQNVLKQLALFTKSDGKGVFGTVFLKREYIEAQQRGTSVLDGKRLRLATPIEAIGYVAKEPVATTARRVGVISCNPFGIPLGDWTISFEQWESEFKIVIAQLNWRYLSRWPEFEDPLLVVKE